MNTARLIKDNLQDFRGHAALFECEPPMQGHEFNEPRLSFTYVVASCATILGEPETYLFGANDKGEIVSWGELPGSYKGRLDHAQAFENAGYKVVRA